MYGQTIDQFFNLKLPMRFPQLKGLTNGFDNALQQYTNKVVLQLGVQYYFQKCRFALTEFLLYHCLSLEFYWYVKYSISGFQHAAPKAPVLI